AEQVRGRSLLLLGNLDEGLQVIHEAIRLAEEQDDLTNLALSLCMEGLVYWLQGRFREGRECTGRAVEVATRLADPLTLALARTGWGMLMWYLGDWERARHELS